MCYCAAVSSIAWSAKATAAAISHASRPIAKRIRGALKPALPAVLAYAGLRLVGVVALAIAGDHFGPGLATVLTRYDGEWYIGIAAHGYDTVVQAYPDGSPTASNLAFFPLYPALIAVTDPLLPGGPGLTAVGVSGTAGLAAAWGLFALGQRLRDRRTGIVLAALWAVVPHAMVQSMAYTETLLTALAAWSLYCVIERRWLLAGVLSVAAGLTRPTSAALVAAVGLAGLVAAWQGQDRMRAVAAMLMAPLGLLAYVGWVGWRLGRIDGYFYVQSAWDSTFDGGVGTLRELERVLTSDVALQWVVVTAVLVVGLVLLALAVAERLPWPMLVYAGMLLVIALGTGGPFYYSKGRFLIPAFPLLLPIAFGLAAARPRTRVTVLSLLALASAWYGIYLAFIWRSSP